MEWVKPIDQVERETRERGFFLLVNRDGVLWTFGPNKTQAQVNQLRDSLKKRRIEMSSFLIARARAKGEDK